MRSHAKASSAGPNAGSGNGRGLFRRAFATRGASSDVGGSGARSVRLFGLAVLLVGLFTAMLGSGSAQAALKWFNTGEFANGGFSDPTKIAVDNSSGNVLVVDSGKGRVQVFDSGGTAASLLTNFGEGELANPYGIAVDQSNGDVYVSNSVYETQSIDTSNTSGGTYTLSFGGETTEPISYNTDALNIQTPLESLSAIGIKNVDVRVNVEGDISHRIISFKGSLAETDVEQITVDGSGLEAASPEVGPAKISVETIRQGSSGEIVKFAPDNRANPTSYGKIPSFTSPPRGSDAEAGQIGRFASAIAVDPTNGNLLVADAGNLHVSRFTSSGSHVDSFNGEDSADGAFTSLLDLAIGATGDVYVVADGLLNADFGRYGVIAGSRIEQFAPNGESRGALDASGALDSARSIAFNPSSGDVLVAIGGGVFNVAGPASVLFLNAGDDFSSVQNAVTENRNVGLALNADSTRLYSVTGREETVFGPLGFASVQIFEQKFVPEVSLDPPSQVAPHGVHLSGTVNPGGEADTHYHFEYSSDSGASWTSTPDVAAGTGNAPESVEADVTGLEHITGYQVRLVASNKYDSATSPIQSFTTQPVLPDVVTGSASARSARVTNLRGTVNSNGAQTTYHFEYGTSTAYELRAPGFEVPTGAERIPRYVAQIAEGLQPGVTYHYRLVAHNAAGTQAGEDKVFTAPLTISGGPERSYELVSPADKAGGGIEARLFAGSEDGNTIGYFAKVGLGPNPTESGPAFRRFIARRTDSGWSSNATEPPQLSPPLPGTFSVALTFTMAVSRDSRKAVVLSNQKLAEGATDHGTNIYLRDVATGAYQTLASEPDEAYYIGTLQLGSAPVVFGGSTSFDRIIIPARGTGFPAGSLVEFHDGQLHAASVDPGGNTVEAIFLDISKDGSRVFFGSEGVFYVRLNGTSTKVIPGRYVGSSRDGSVAYSFGEGLTEDSAPGVRYLYRFSVDSGALEKLVPIGPEDTDSTRALDISDNGAAVYLSSPFDLTEGGGSGRKIYAWYGGELSRVATLPGGTSAFRAEASPNGRYLAFNTNEKVTDYETAGSKCPANGSSPFEACRQVYRYDAAAEELACASCRPDGAPSLGHAEMGEPNVDTGGGRPPHVVTDTGQVFFDTTEQLVLADSNSVQDVYEYDGDIRLISSGRGLPSIIAEVSPDGRDVFFTTKDQLVGIDTDDATDLYDARVGGGIASQNPPPAREECIRDDCKATPNVGPELPFGGSEGLSGPENVKEAAKKRCGKGRHARKVKGKQRCVKQKKNRANNNRRQGR